jgi:hypothetical protein
MTGGLAAAGTAMPLDIGVLTFLATIEPNVLKTGLHPLDEIHPFCSRERIPQGLPRLPISGRCQRLVDDRGFE